MKPIEETHPSIAIKEDTVVDRFDLYYTHWQVEELLKDVQKHTVDKAVLKKLMTEFYSPEYADNHSMDLDGFYEHLNKKLGLD